jgi:hypothetical protein
MLEKLSFQGAFRKGDPDPPFVHIPFTVPPGTCRIEVSYHFDRDESLQPEWGADDVVDIGVFDARGTEFLDSTGFRGWSGSSKRSFFISREDATPGYVRGPMVPGEWNLFMSCRILFSDVCRYWIYVTLDVDPVAAGDVASPAATPARGAIAPRQGPGRWYKGDFHSHTMHSDGLNTIDEYAVAAPRAGLDFLAVTDHNTVSHFDEIACRSPDDFLLIPGEEVTTFWGHANVWGTGGWVDFRCHDDATMQQLVDWVHARGGLFSPNHPKTGWPWEFAGVRGFSAVEAWQGAWRFYNEQSLDFWERRLRAGERPTAVGGSDCHSLPPAQPKQPWTVGTPCTWVYCRGALDEAAVLDGVRRGNVILSEDPTGPYLEFGATCDGRSYMMGETVEARDGALLRLRLHYQGPVDKKLRVLRNGEVWQQCVADKEDVTLEFELPVEEPGYVRAEVMGFRGRPERGEVVHAMTNPIYLQLQEP